MKLCKDCRWCKESGEFSTCHAPQAFVKKDNELKLVTGETGEVSEEHFWKYCTVNRNSKYDPLVSFFRLIGFEQHMLCTPKALWFEQKEVTE